ncbi:unnamed protein product, partial [Ilex paraguariensis]
ILLTVYIYDDAPPLPTPEIDLTPLSDDAPLPIEPHASFEVLVPPLEPSSDAIHAAPLVVSSPPCSIDTELEEHLVKKKRMTESPLQLNGQFLPFALY